MKEKQIAASVEGSKIFGITVPALPASELPIVSPDVSSYPNPAEYPLSQIERGLQHFADFVGGEAGVELVVTEPPQDVKTDFGMACHRLAKVYRKNPGQIAQDLAERLKGEQIPFVEHIESTTTGYLNFELDVPSFGNAVLKDIEARQSQYGYENLGNGKTVIIDCSSPNVAKYMSVGHLRSTVNGESLARIYRAGGYRVIRDNHLGDWGTQFGMLGRAKELWGDEIDRDMSDAEPVQKLYRLYVRMHEEIEKEKAENPEGESSLEKEGRAWFRNLESGDSTARALLKECTEQSMQEFQRVYDVLGSAYEYYLGESFYVPMLPSLISAFEHQGIAHTDERGVVVVEFPEEEKLHTLVIKKSDGSSLYSTRDLAGLVARTAWFHPDKILYVVGGEQRAYFKQVFSAFEKLAGDKTPELTHVTFGMVSLPEGKMSTRKGRVVFLEDVLNEAISRAKAKVQAGKNLTPEEVETVARQVGVGAVIFMDLGQSRDRNITFDWDKALSLEGNSGPYIQYAHARASSILRKAGEQNIVIDTDKDAIFTLPIESELIKHLGKFPGVIEQAIIDNESSIVSAYVQKLADLYNKFYSEAYILSDTDENRRNSRLRLTAACARVIKNALYLLGIEAPDKM